MSDAAIVDAAVSWYMSRTAFLKLPPNAPETRLLLNDLANAEDSLSKAVKDGVRKAFGNADQP